MDSSLGKRKEREEGDKTHGSTLFVSNLPYNATSVDLETLFSDIAPVKSAFVVTEQGTGVSKGVGYVVFALKEDAESAFETISKDGIDLVGRKLRIQWADQKPLQPKEKGERIPKPAKPAKPRPVIIARHPHDPNAIRTIVVSGLPSALDSKVLWKKMRKYPGVDKVEWPVKGDDDVEDPSTAHVLFKTPANASDAVTKLHAHVYKGSLLSVTLKKRLENLAKPVAPKKSKSENDGDASPQKGKSAAAAPSHASRLIVRNLPFQATEQDLRAIFLPYGPIHSIHIPLEEGPKKEGNEPESSTAAATAAAYAAVRLPRTKGFAFVWMLSKKDAERALEACNGMVFRAGVAQQLLSDKQKKKKVKRLEKKMQDASAKPKEAGKGDEDKEEEAEEKEQSGAESEEEKEEKVEEKEDDKRAVERVIAVDWALSKERWKEEKAKAEEEMSSDSEESDDSEDEGLGVHGSESGGSDEDDDDDDDDDDEDRDEEPVKPQLPPPETGTTLFIRNIPFDATEEDLRTLFRAFGPLRYARITMDRETGRSRGTGFACFWNVADADKAVQQSELLRSEATSLPSTIPKKNPFQMPSILTPDPSSSLAQSLVLHGRTLDVVRAVTRDTAAKLKDDNEKSRQKDDKRNMYLLREGVIMPNSPAAALLTPAEVERRTSSFNARRSLLKSNPSLFISKTRLSVRQIPTFVTEHMLKRLAIHAMKAFNSEYKQGKREGLSPDELADPPAAQKEEDTAMEVDEEGGKPKKKKFTGRDTGVKQTKIVRQVERVDALTGKGRSKGYGFVEMTKHSDALRLLRWANNNPEVGPLFESWWKDELERMLKAERSKDEKDRDEDRIKRLKDAIENSAESKKTKGNLIVEFSIENVQVVQRRNAAAQAGKDKAAGVQTGDKRRSRPDESDVKPERSEPQPKKKRRLSTDTPQKAKALEESADDKKPAEAANPLGSIIGRKRKERKSGKKGKS